MKSYSKAETIYLPYMAKDHSLSNSKHAVNVRNGSVFVFLALTDDIVLFDVVK